jgi:hypothetical protein
MIAVNSYRVPAIRISGCDCLRSCSVYARSSQQAQEYLRQVFAMLDQLYLGQLFDELPAEAGQSSLVFQLPGNSVLEIGEAQQDSHPRAAQHEESTGSS